MTKPEIIYWRACLRTAIDAALDAKQYLRTEPHGGTSSRQDLELIHRIARAANAQIEELIDTIDHRLEKKGA